MRALCGAIFLATTFIAGFVSAEPADASAPSALVETSHPREVEEPAPRVASSSTHPASVSSPSPAKAPLPPSVVRLRERDVFTLRVPRAGQSAPDRARAASEALGRLLEEADAPSPRVEMHGALAVIFVGNTPVVTLGEEDAAAEGDSTLGVHAASIATQVQNALRLERKRRAIATTVFSLSLLVFSGLIAFFLLRRISVVEDKIRAWMEAHPTRLPAVRLGKIEVVSPSAVRGAIGIALHVGHRLAQLAIVYTWLLIAFSFFDATRGYTERLTGFIVTPVSALMARAANALPVLVVGFVAALAVILVVRFVGLFFGSVGRGETNLGWLPSDLAGPTSVLVRAGIVIASLIAAAPLITGSDEGALSRAGVASLLTVALACTPILACGAVGVPIVFGRRLHLGDFVEAGGHAGRVRGVTLLELRLEDAWGCEVRVPHLLALWHPTRVVGRSAMVSMVVALDPFVPLAIVRDCLGVVAKSVSVRLKIELVSLDAEGAHYRISGHDEPGVDFAATVAEALIANRIPFGRSAGRRAETKS